MRIAIGADDRGPLLDALVEALERRGDVAHVGRALGAGGAPEAAHALSVAVGRVA